MPKKPIVRFEVGLKEHAHTANYVKTVKKDLESLAKDIKVHSYHKGDTYLVGGDASQKSYETVFSTKLSYDSIPSKNPKKILSPDYKWVELTSAVVPKILTDRVEYVRLQKMYHKA